MAKLWANVFKHYSHDWSPYLQLRRRLASEQNRNRSKIEIQLQVLFLFLLNLIVFVVWLYSNQVICLVHLIML